jgi:hypothetical protein
MTAGQLRRGFEKLPRPCPAAVLFGLDTSMYPDSVISLTWSDARSMVVNGELSEYAVHILKSQPVHIACKYVFWIEIGGKPQQLFDLEWMISQVFGLLWCELDVACDRLIWIDEDVEASSWEEQWTKITV